MLVIKRNRRKQIIKLAIILFFIAYAVTVTTWWIEGSENYERYDAEQAAQNAGK